MASKFQAEFIAPWTYMKGREQVNSKLFKCETLKPLGPRDFFTYFQNKHETPEIKNQHATLTMYDQLHHKSPYDIDESESNRIKSVIWERIYEENRKRTVAITSAQWYGRSNREQTDFSDRTFFRTRTIEDNFYRRKEVNVPPISDVVQSQTIWN